MDGQQRWAFPGYESSRRFCAKGPGNYGASATKGDSEMIAYTEYNHPWRLARSGEHFRIRVPAQLRCLKRILEKFTRRLQERLNSDIIEG